MTGPAARPLVAVLALACAAPAVAAFALACAAPVVAAVAPAEQAEALPDSLIEARTHEIAAGLRCVVCQGLSIEDSPAELAREMRAIVREQVAAGRTRAEIEAYFVDRYGEFVLLEPRAEGFNLLVYALPVGALAFGALFVAAFVRRWSGPEEAGAGSAAPWDGHDDGRAG